MSKMKTILAPPSEGFYGVWNTQPNVWRLIIVQQILALTHFKDYNGYLFIRKSE